MNPSVISFNKAVDGNPFRRDGIPVGDWRLFWPRIVGNIEIKTDANALEDVVQGIRDEQRLLAISEQNNPNKAFNEYNRRLSEHVDAVSQGKLPADTPFNESRTSVEHDMRAKLNAMQLVLEKKIADHRGSAKRLLISIRDSISAARSERETSEIKEAESWGVPFLPSHPLLVLFSAEQAFTRAIDAFSGLPPGNPTRSTLIHLLPPGFLN